MRVHHPLIQSTVTRPPAFGSRMSGFIQGVLLFGIALLAVVIAAFSMSNKSSTNSTENEEAKTFASTIITHGGSIKTAVDRFRIDRGELTGMNFTATAPNGLFNPNDRLIQTLTVQPRAFIAAQIPPMQTAPTDQRNGAYYLRTGGTITIGGQAVSHIVSTTGLTERTCQRINVNLHGAAFAGAPPTLTAGALADFQGTATAAITITSGTATGAHFPNVATLEEGCVRTTGGTTGQFVYFKVLALP